MIIAAPVFLYILPLVWAAMAWALRRSEKRRRALLKEFASNTSWPEISKKRLRIDRGLLFFGVTMLFLTLSRPMIFHDDDRDEMQGAPYLIALDASRSMLAVDVQPTRYENSIEALDTFFAETRGDHIGLLTFAGVAYLNSPMTFDMRALRTILRYIDPYNMSDPGSSITSAIDRAGRFFRSNSIPERTLIIISDGEDLEGSAVPLARKLHRDEKVTIHTIGVGTATGAGIPALRTEAMVTNSYGRFVVTKLDESNLRRIANAAGGRYYPLGQNGWGLRQLRQEVLIPLADKMARNDLQNYREAFYAPLLVAAAAFAAKLLLAADRFTRKRPLPAIAQSK